MFSRHSARFGKLAVHVFRQEAYERLKRPQCSAGATGNAKKQRLRVHRILICIRSAHTATASSNIISVRFLGLLHLFLSVFESLLHPGMFVTTVLLCVIANFALKRVKLFGAKRCDVSRKKFEGGAGTKGDQQARTQSKLTASVPWRRFRARNVADLVVAILAAKSAPCSRVRTVAEAIILNHPPQIS